MGAVPGSGVGRQGLEAPRPERARRATSLGSYSDLPVPFLRHTSSAREQAANIQTLACPILDPRGTCPIDDWPVPWPSFRLACPIVAWPIRTLDCPILEVPVPSLMYLSHGQASRTSCEHRLECLSHCGSACVGVLLKNNSTISL